MPFFHLLILLVVAGIAGAVGKSLAGFSPGGFITSIALGFVGALLGSWIATHLGLPELLTIGVGSQSFPLVWSIVGATLFVGLLGLFHRHPAPAEKAR